MRVGLRSRRAWVLCLVGIVAMGIGSRLVHTGFVIFDKYLGDALYAAMVYAILRIGWRSAAVAVPAMVAMSALELFQLTMIPARWMASEHLFVRLCPRLLGTEFGWLDLLAYVAGIGCMYLMDASHEAMPP